MFTLPKRKYSKEELTPDQIEKQTLQTIKQLLDSTIKRVSDFSEEKQLEEKYRPTFIRLAKQIYNIQTEFMKENTTLDDKIALVNQVTSKFKHAWNTLYPDRKIDDKNTTGSWKLHWFGLKETCASNIKETFDLYYGGEQISLEYRVQVLERIMNQKTVLTM